ncbi:MAG TPA: hypothetical protein VH079_14365 [Terriglobales bacterium]|jgi:hypothetical protein|nr:hypothetical protein [Terriglobales bacterium]
MMTLLYLFVYVFATVFGVQNKHTACALWPPSFTFFRFLAHVQPEVSVHPRCHPDGCFLHKVDRALADCLVLIREIAVAIASILMPRGCASCLAKAVALRFGLIPQLWACRVLFHFSVSSNKALGCKSSLPVASD